MGLQAASQVRTRSSPLAYAAPGRSRFHGQSGHPSEGSLLPRM